MFSPLRIVCLLSYIITLIFFSTCRQIEEFNEDPEIIPLQQGIQITNAIGYSTSIALAAFQGQPLPDNVVFEGNNDGEFTSSGIMYVNIDENHPLPFNNKIGDIVIAGIWEEGEGGVISILFADIDLLSPEFEFMGIHTVPIVNEDDFGGYTTIFAEEDIVTGEGEDTLLNISLTSLQFEIELERARGQQPEDPFAAVKQNAWFVNIDQNNTVADVYDDRYTIYGGGQIVEARAETGGIQYHAMIGTEFEYSNCTLNPTDGIGFIQNLKAGSTLDLGNITLQFRDECDGKAHVKIAAGKYLNTIGRDVNLNLN